MATAVVALVVLAAGFATYSAQLRRTVRERDESNALLKVANIETAHALRESKEAGERADRALQESREQIYAQDMEHAGRESEGEDLSQASNLLASHVPQSGETDLRGFEWYWLRGRLRGTGPTLHVSQKPVYDVEYSPDGLRLATGGADAVLHVFDTKTGHELLGVATGQIEVNAVAFAPDGKTIATTGDDGTIRLWDARDGQPRLRIDGPPGRHPFSVLYTPDGRQLVSNANDPLIRIWNAQTGELEAELRGSEGKESVTQIALTRDGKTLASGSDDGAARLWDLTTRTCRRTLRANEGSCLAVAFSPDARLLVAGYSDRTVRLWICADGTTAPIGVLRDSLHDVCFLPTGEGVVAADSGGSIRVWNILPGLAFSAPSATRSAAFYSLYNGRSDRSVRRWQRHVGAIHRIAVARDGNTVASAGNDGTVSLTDLRSAVRDGPLAGFESPWLVSQFRFGPHDELLWGDRATLGESYTPGGNGWVTNLETGHTEKWTSGDSTSGIALTPDGAGVLLGNDHGSMTTLHPQRPRETWDFKANGHLEQIDFAPDGRTLIVRFQSGPDGFRMYDYPTHGRLDRPPSGLVGNPTTFARCGWWLVTNGDRMGSVWDLRSPASPAHTFAYSNLILALAVSPDGKLFASGGDDRKIALRSLSTGAVQNELIGHQAFVTSLAFSPDGRTLLSGDLSGMTKVWSVPTGRYVCDLAHDARRKSEHIEFSPSGRYLAYAAYHGPLIVLDLWKLRADEQGPAAWGTAMPHPTSDKTIFDRYGIPPASD